VAAQADTVRAWLRGAHVGRFGSFPSAAQGSPKFVDITPEHLAGRLRVAKMVTGVGLALTFGLGTPTWRALRSSGRIRLHDGAPLPRCQRASLVTTGTCGILGRC
jgi:hypothetical protein